MLYLDAAATAPVRREALEAMWPYLTGDFGNPSSRHTVGESAARGLEEARVRVAGFLNCRPAEVVFTGGGTEADNLAIKGMALGRPRGRHIVTTAIEHEAVLESVEFLRRMHGFVVSFVPLTAEGVVTPEALAAVLRPDSTLVSIAHANNEVGTVQELARLTAVTRAIGVPFHTDAVQSAGQLPIDVAALGVQALSLSGHKLGAPKGTGVLYISGRVPLEPVLHGGGQERGRRSGTENVAGAVALGVAALLAAAEGAAAEAGGSGAAEAAGAEAASAGSATQDFAATTTATTSARDAFIAEILSRQPSARLTGARPVPGARLPRHASFVFPGTNGETVLLELERRGVVSSSGSACAAGSDEPSHVLTALGFDADVAQTAVRFTWGADMTAERLLPVAALVEESVEAVRGIAS